MVFPEGAEITSDYGYLIKDPKKRRDCPLCKTELKLYEVAQRELILMCPVLDCLFPTTEELQIVKDESELLDNDSSQKPVKEHSKKFCEFTVPHADPGTPAPILTATSTAVSSTPLSSLLQSERDTSAKQSKMSMKKQKNRKRQMEEKDMLTCLKEIKSNVNEMKIMNDDEEIVGVVMKNPKLLNLKKNGQIGDTLMKNEKKEKKINIEEEFVLGDVNISVDLQGNTTANVMVVANASQVVQTLEL